jgi:hypothetical protein
MSIIKIKTGTFSPLLEEGVSVIGDITFYPAKNDSEHGEWRCLANVFGALCLIAVKVNFGRTINNDTERMKQLQQEILAITQQKES